MATEPGIATDVGRSPGTSLKQDESGATQFEEQRENGLYKLTTVLPDGTVSRTIDRTDPSTGITTKVERHADGRMERTVEWPGGQIQTLTQYPDGSSEGHRTFQGPDGTRWSQAVSRDGRMETAHDTYDPDGTFRQTIRKPDGSLEVTTTKSTKLDNGSEMTQVRSPNGDVMTRVARSDGSSESTTLHADGSRETLTVSRTSDGKLVTHSVAADGSESTVSEWTTPDGHEHRSVMGADGSTAKSENWEDRLPDGTSVLHRNGPDGSETVTNRPDGSTERIKHHADGSTSSFTRTKDPDGSIHEHQVRADGSTRDARFTQNPDGSYTTHTREFDGVERTTMVGRDGRVEVHTLNPDGSRTDSSYSSDGSGRTDILDADGNIERSIPIESDPRPIPHGDYDPEAFLELAQRELSPDIGAMTPTAEVGGFASVPLSDAEVQFLSERGVAPPGASSVQSDPTVTDMASPQPPPTGEGPGRSLDRSSPGPAMLSEELPDGTHKLTGVNPDGSVVNIVERTDPSTGINTKVERITDGDVETTIDSPGGTRQVITHHPDGSEEIFRAFAGPDGSRWSQSINAGGIKTTHQTFDPDGTLRETVKQPDGTVEVTSSKTTISEDGSSVSEVHSPNGDVSTMITRQDGTSEMRLVHSDGSEVVSTTTLLPDGSTVARVQAEDGSVTTTTKWTTPDGHSHETIARPDGSSESYETWGEVRPDGSSFVAAIGPTGSETTNYHSDGSIDQIKNNADGTTESYTLTKNSDGSMIERQTRADGTTSETHYESRSLDGSYTTVVRNFDGVETRTTIDENGRIGVRELQLDGTSTETDYNPDGSGRTVTLDAAGNVTSEAAIEPVPTPVPRDFEPDRFFSQAQAELPPDVEALGAMSMPDEPESRMFSDAEVDLLSERGIAPIGIAGAADLDDATVGEALSGAPRAYEEAGSGIAMPPGALGDPDSLVGAYPIDPEAAPGGSIASNPDTVGFEVDGEPDSVAVDESEERTTTPEQFPEERLWPGEEQIDGMEPEAQMGIDPTPVDAPEEDLTRPEPNQEEQTWPDE